MRNIHRIGIGFLVGLFFAVGYSARLSSTAREERLARAVQRTSGIALGTQVASAGLEGAADIDLKPMQTMLIILRSLREHYVEQITPDDEGKMAYDSLRAMLGALDDPNTRFVDPAQRRLIAEAQEGSFHGIGAILGIKRVKVDKLTQEHLIVIAPLESGPAAAGLRPGDDIVAINGKAVLPFDPYQKAQEIIKTEWNTRAVEKSKVKKHLEAERNRIETGIPILAAENRLVSDEAEPGDNKSDEKTSKDIELSVVRKGSPKEFKIKLAPRQFTVTPVTSSLIEDGKLGYIRVNCFSRATGEQFQNAIADLKSKQASGLVLDLRNLAGGDVESVLAIAKPLLPGKTLGTELKSRGRRSWIRVPEAAPEETWQQPIIALVNGGTARMSELLAAGLKENRRARLVGEKTYGDLSQTTLIDQRDGSAIVMTTGAFLTRNGANYNGKGLSVDVEVASGASGDPQLKEAARLLMSGGGRG